LKGCVAQLLQQIELHGDEIYESLGRNMNRYIWGGGIRYSDASMSYAYDTA
jgi:hypothetical protein